MINKLEPLIVAHLQEHGPATPPAIAQALGKTDSRAVWRNVLRMSNAGQLQFDTTGRIVSLPDPT